MIEIAPVLIATALGAGGLGWVATSLRKQPVVGEAPPVPARAVRDDALAGAALAPVLLLAVAAGRGPTPFARDALAAGAWACGSCAAGVLVTTLARALRDWAARAAAARAPDGGPLELAVRASAVGPLADLLGALAGLTVLVFAAWAVSGAFAAPQRLAPHVAWLIAGFASGVAAVASGDERARPSSEAAVETGAAMLVAAYFFDQNSGALQAGPGYESALGLLLFPVAARALGAVAAVFGVASLRVGPRETEGAAMSRAFFVAAILTLFGIVGAASALSGSLWLVLVFCGAAGIAATAGVFSVARASARPRLVEVVSFLCVALAALASAAVAARSGKAHAAAFGVVVAAIGAQGAAVLLQVASGAQPDAWRETHEAARVAARVGAVLGALAVGLAVLDAVSAAACARWAMTMHAPAADHATLLTRCAVAGVAVRGIDVARPAVAVAVLGALVLGALVRGGPSLRARVRTTFVVVAAVCATGVLLRVGFGAGAQAVAGAALALLVASALGEAVSRPIALTFAALAMVLAPIVG